MFDYFNRGDFMIGEYKVIALCTCRIQDEESHNFIAMLNEKLVKIGCRLFIFNMSLVTPMGLEETDPQLSIYKLINKKYIDAVIIQADRFFNPKVCESIVNKSLSVGLPVVSLGLEFEHCLNIHYNHQKGFKDIIEHLIKDHNIRDFHMIAGLINDKYSNERIEIFKNVLSDYNIEFFDDMISYGQYWPEPAKREVQRLIDNNKLPRAFICANDKMAIAVTELLIQNGINVPNDIAVTGFDCIDAIYSSEPTITSAYISPKVSAQVIFETVREALYFNRHEGTISLDSHIVVNESCGCKSHEKINLTPYLNEQISRFCQFQDDDMYFADMGTKIQNCNNFEEAVSVFDKNHLMNDTIVLLKKVVLDIQKNPNILHEKEFSNEMYLLYSGDTYEKNKIIKFDYLIPSLEEYLNDGRSLIFTALHYLDVPLGYVCCTFKEHVIANYYRTPQIIRMLNNGLGGLRNSRHHKFLTSEIEKLYRIDALTGLYNRRGFLIEYDKLLKEKDMPLTVIMCDLDGLKIINDNYGHEEGDLAIQNVAEALRYCSPNDSIFTRFGGDEMLAVCPGSLNDDEIRKQFKAFLSDYNNKAKKPYITSASIGIYHTNVNAMHGLEELIKYSDIEMYKDKSNNKL